MINLLPYSRRIFLKSLYKKRLLVVGLFSVTIAMLPLILVLGLFSYLEYSNSNVLQDQYNNLVSLQESGEAKGLFDQVKQANSTIDFFKNDTNSVKPVTTNIEKVLALRPNDIRITAIDYTKNEKVNVLNINGVSGTRDSILKYSEILDMKKSGFCKSVSVPVDTYTKKTDLPFTITCNIEYETK
jgi:hypothetical protein